MKILYFVAEDYYFCSHRLPVARAALASGYEVIVVTQVTDLSEFIGREGFKLIPIRINRSGTGIIENLKLINQLRKILREERPDILHNVAIKPIVMGSIACMLGSRRSKIINAFAGLGYVFTSDERRARRLRFILSRLYRALFKSKRVSLLFQNQDDQQYFDRRRLVRLDKTTVIPGSGVDISHYAPLPHRDGPFTIAFVARLLRDKGIYEFIEAARRVKAARPELRFIVAGSPDPQNPSSISSDEVEAWVAEGLIDYWGHVDDVRTVFKEADVVTLPSYREGLPKVLLEASACQKAIITTDVPGCRELIQDQDNGLLVPAQSSAALAEAMLRLRQDDALRQQLAATARERVMTTFSDHVIGQQTIDLYQALFKS